MPTPAQSRQRGENVGFRSRIWPFAKREISALKHASTLPTKETQCSTGRIWHSHPRARKTTVSDGHKPSEAFLCVLRSPSALSAFQDFDLSCGASGNPAKQSL